MSNRFRILVEREFFSGTEDQTDHCPMLIISERGLGYTVCREASLQRLGFVLEQLDRLIAFGSRQLTDHESNYSTHELKLTAVVIALKTWRRHLYSERFEVLSDHKSISLSGT